MSSYVLSLPNGAYLYQASDTTAIATATKFTVLQLIKASVLLNCVADVNGTAYTMFSIENSNIFGGVKAQGYIKNDSGLLAVKLSVAAGATYFNSFDISSLSSTDFVFLTWRFDPTHGTAWNRFAIRKLDGTVVASKDQNTDNTAADTSNGMGALVLGNSRIFKLESGQIKAQVHDGVAIFNRSITAAEEYAIPDPNGSGVLLSVSFSDGSGSTATNDTTGGVNLTVSGTPTWTAGGTWDLPTTNSPTVTPTGQAITVSQGAPAVALTLQTMSPISLLMGVTQGTPSVSIGGATNTITPTGQTISFSMGTFAVQADNDYGPTGQAITFAQGSPAINTSGNFTVAPVGQSISLVQGTPTVSLPAQSPTVTPDSLLITVTQGTIAVGIDGSAVTIIPVGQAFPFSLGTPGPLSSVLPAPSGQSITMVQGTPTILLVGDIVQPLTGQAITLAQGVPTLSIASVIHATVVPTSQRIIISQGLLGGNLTLRPTTVLRPLGFGFGLRR